MVLLVPARWVLHLETWSGRGSSCRVVSPKRLLLLTQGSLQVNLEKEKEECGQGYAPRVTDMNA